MYSGKCFGGPMDGQFMEHDRDIFLVNLQTYNPIQPWEGMPLDTVSFRTGSYRFERLNIFRRMVPVWLYWGEQKYTGRSYDCEGWRHLEHAMEKVFI